MDLVEDLDAFAEIEADWRRLAELRGNAFVTPEWFRAWHRHYGRSAAPFVLVVRAGGAELRGLMPLTLVRRGRAKILHFAGWNHGDHFHPVCAEEAQDEIAEAAMRALPAHLHRVSLLLDNVSAEASWWRDLAPLRPGFGAVHLRQSSLPYIPMRGSTWQDYLASRSRNFRSQAGRRRRNLERGHEVRFRRSEDPSHIEADMDTFFELHDARWAVRSGSSLAGERPRAFHLDFARAAQARGWLRLWFLEIDGVPAAAWYGWRVGGRYAYYSAGFSEEWAEAGVGGLLLGHTIESAFSEAAEEYDMLLGDEPYKLRFASAERRVQTVALAPRLGWRGLRLRLDAGLWRTSRRLPDWARRRGGSVYRALSKGGAARRER